MAQLLFFACALVIVAAFVGKHTQRGALKTIIFSLVLFLGPILLFRYFN